MERSVYKMALFQCNFFSTALSFGSNVDVFLPSVMPGYETDRDKQVYAEAGKRFQILYLLHGAYDDHTNWLLQTSIVRYAQDRCLAVVMPSASNSFYQDMYYGSAYFTYLSKELPQFIESMFPVSTRREDTFVAGNSMGGYGALKLAFEQPERFCACASLSGAIDLAECIRLFSKGSIQGPFRFDCVFSPDTLRDVEETDANLFRLIAGRRRQGRPLPKVFQTCGTEDFLYDLNRRSRRKLAELGVDLTYEEHPGVHGWKYWDENICRVLDWLPLARGPVGK